MKAGLLLSAVLAPLVSAFIDTSPLFLYSTQDLPHNIQLDKFQPLATADQFLNAVKTTVAQCSSDAYILVLQPGVHESDFVDPRSTPQIRKFTQSGRFIGVMDSVGYIDLNEIERFVKTKCQAHTITVDASTSSFNSFEENSTAQVIKLDFPVLPTSGLTRQKALTQNDNFLSALISMMPSTKYTVVYVSTPVGDPRYLIREPQHSKQQENESFLPVEPILVQRDAPVSAEKTNSTDNYGGLLDHYQFFTPVLLTSIFLILFFVYIVYLALGALSGIQVSYGSVEKEIGSHEQKKHK